MNSDKEVLGKDPIPNLLIRLAAPTVVAQLVNMLYNIVDRIYIGHMPGDGALALTGVGVCMPLIMVVSAFAALVSSGGAPRASIFMGKKKYNEAEEILGNCFMLLIIISMALTLALLFFHKPILLAFGASENTITYASSYMNIYALGTIFVQLTLGCNMFITAQGFAKTGMLTVLIGSVINIVLDPIFIFGFHLGVRGAALATILSQGASCLWCILFLCRERSFLRIRKKYFRLKWNVIIPCIVLGMATFIMQVSESIIAVCFNASLLKYGGDIAVGAMTICTSTMQFAMLPMQGMGQGAQPITSYNYGAHNAKRVKETFLLLLKACLLFSIVLTSAIMVFPKVFASIFSSDADLIDYSAMALRIYCGGMFLFGAQMACQMTFTAIGNARCSILVAVVRKFILLIPLIYLLPHLGLLEDQTKAVYLAEPIADISAIIFTILLFQYEFRKALRHIDEV